jgi:hypothetical protein
MNADALDGDVTGRLRRGLYDGGRTPSLFSSASASIGGGGEAGGRGGRGRTPKVDAIVRGAGGRAYCSARPYHAFGAVPTIIPVSMAGWQRRRKNPVNVLHDEHAVSKLAAGG